MSEVDLAQLLEQARKHTAKKANATPKTPERRARQRAQRQWDSNLFWVWHQAHLLNDAELVWLSGISGTSKVHSAGDATQLQKLEAELSRRRADCERRQRVAVAEALRRLGLPVPRHLAARLP